MIVHLSVLLTWTDVYLVVEFFSKAWVCFPEVCKFASILTQALVNVCVSRVVRQLHNEMSQYQVYWFDSCVSEFQWYTNFRLLTLGLDSGNHKPSLKPNCQWHPSQCEFMRSFPFCFSSFNNPSPVATWRFHGSDLKSCFYAISSLGIWFSKPS